MARRPRPPVTVTIPRPAVGSSQLPGAANGVFVLGSGLAIVALWDTDVYPLLESAWNGTPLALGVPPGGILALVGFIVLLVFIASLSDAAASLIFLLLLGLWAVYLIMNPGVLTGIAQAISQQPGHVPSIPAPAGTQTSASAIPVNPQTGQPLPASGH